MPAAAWFGSLAVLKSEVSSAKSFMSHLMLAVNSLKYTWKYKWFRIEPCGTPADIELHADVLPYKTVRCFLLSRKLSKRTRKFPETPQLRSFYIRPSCQT